MKTQIDVDLEDLVIMTAAVSIYGKLFAKKGGKVEARADELARIMTATVDTLITKKIYDPVEMALVLDELAQNTKQMEKAK